MIGVTRVGKAYTKEFLVDAALSRFAILGDEYISKARPMYEETYDKYGKDEFRKYTCLDAEAIRTYKLSAPSGQ